MTTITLKGRITADGKLAVDLPENLPNDDFELVIQVSRQTPPLPDDAPLTPEELEAMLHFQGKSLGEILDSGLVGSGADWDIGDSEEWVQEQRRKDQELRQARWTDS